jgi:hypothetical protein
MKATEDNPTPKPQQVETNSSPIKTSIRLKPPKQEPKVEFFQYAINAIFILNPLFLSIVKNKAHKKTSRLALCINKIYG